MRPTLDQLKSALNDEAARHALDPQSVRLDIPLVIVSAHECGFNHGAKCICGHEFNIVTQHSANTPAGGAQLGNALTTDYAEHFRNAIAQMVYALYEPTQ